MWRKLYTTVALTAGQTHTFKIWGREASLEIDKVVLVPTNSGYAPSSTGPATSTRSGGTGTGGEPEEPSEPTNPVNPTNPSGTGAYQQGSDKLFSLEAENATRTAVSSGEWALTSDSSQSNGRGVKLDISTWGYSAANVGPSLAWTLNSDSAGDYSVYLRIRTTDGDSVFTDMDNKIATQHFGASTTWVWRKLINPVELGAGGTHRFKIWGREASLEIDKVVLVPVAGSYVPSDNGPTESTREGEPTDGTDTGGNTGGTGGSGGTGGGNSGSGSYAQDPTDRFSLEAENAERTEVSSGKWADVSGTDLSNDRGVKLDLTTWGYSSSGVGPSLTWTLDVTNGGDYTVWMRIRTTDGDSVFTDMDGETLDQHFGGSVAWVWRKLYGPVALNSGGLHTFKIWARENALEIDKVVLLPADDGFIPTGEGPTESTRDGVAPSSGDTGSTDTGGGSTSGGASSGTGSFVQSTNGVVSLEAESAEATDLGASKWSPISDGGAAGGAGMQKIGGGWYGSGSGPRIGWTVKAQTSGNYDIWVRGRPNETGDSVWVDWDGTAVQYFWYASHYGNWVWHKSTNTPVALSAGNTHALRLWAREDTMEIDKVVLVPAGSGAPSGAGPAESTRDGVPVSGALTRAPELSFAVSDSQPHYGPQ